MPLVDRQAAIIETRHLRALSATLHGDSVRARSRAEVVHGDSVRACSRTDVVRERLRQTLLRYGLRRMHPLRGASEVNGDGDRRRLLIRSIAAHALMKPAAGPSAGATCTLCREEIAVGRLQYEMTVGEMTVIADERCYTSSLRDIVEAGPESKGYMP